MRASNSLARQSVNERLDKMRQSSTFDVDAEMRGYIQNPELQELLERCDQKSGGAQRDGTTKVSLGTMRDVLREMQSEGKLGAMGGGEGRGADGGMTRPKSAGALM